MESVCLIPKQIDLIHPLQLLRGSAYSEPYSEEPRGGAPPPLHLLPAGHQASAVIHSPHITVHFMQNANPRPEPNTFGPELCKVGIKRAVRWLWKVGFSLRAVTVPDT